MSKKVIVKVSCKIYSGPGLETELREKKPEPGAERNICGSPESVSELKEIISAPQH
jgi:hypothetical protein